MPTRDPSTAARNAIDASNQLDGFGITLGADAAKWLTKLLELRANPPVEPPANEVAELIAGSASATAIDRALAQKLGAALRAGQHMRATQIVGGRVLDAILGDRDRVHAELSTTATGIIERLHRAALIDASIIELTRARRTDEAHALAVAESDTAELSDLYQVRNNVLTTPGARWSTGWWDCAIWQTPWDTAIGHVSETDGSKWGLWRATIRAGGRLWYPTHEQATTASQAHEPADMLPPINPRRTGNATFITS